MATLVSDKVISMRQLSIHCQLLQAQAAALRRVGQGGLNEVAGEAGEDAAASSLLAGDDPRRRNDNLISDTELQRQPSEAEQAIRLLVGQLRLLRGLPSLDAGVPACCLATSGEFVQRAHWLIRTAAPLRTGKRTT